MSEHDQTAVGAAARHLVRAAARGSLATVMRESGGAPYVSLVGLATDHDGSPILLISDLADHTKNLKLDDRVSLLVANETGHEDPLAGERLSVQGSLNPSDAPSLRERYLAKNPKAALYADFNDFGFYRLTMEKAHLIAGFGRIHWIDGDLLTVEPPEALIAAERDIVEHMNTDHADAVDLYATKLLGLSEGGWSMTGVDSEGADLRKDDKTARLPFGQVVNDSTDVRKELVRLVNKARDS